MAMFSFNRLQIPPIKDKLSGPAYENFKRTLLSLMFGQRIEVFESESSRSGKWVPLASDTNVLRLSKVPKKKRKKKGAVKILQDTGLLRNSFTLPGAQNQTTETSGDEVSLQTNVEYAAIHNFGGTINHPGTSNGFGREIEIPPHRITIPARPFDQFTDPHIKEINQLTESYLNED